MPYIFVRTTMNQTNVHTVFEGTTTYIDFHLLFDESRSHLYRQLQRVGLTDLTRLDPDPHVPRTRGTPVYVRKTYQTSAPAYAVLNALETCDYKVVAASSCSTPSGSEYMWTLQGPVDREVDQAQASFSDF